MKKTILYLLLLCQFPIYSQFTFRWADHMNALDDWWADSHAVTTDNKGNIYITGIFADTLDFDPGPGIYKLAPIYGSEAAFVCKLTANGELIWAKHFTGLHSWVEGNSISVDPEGNVYTTGLFSFTVDFDPGSGIHNLSANYYDVYVSKLDSSGNFIWARGTRGTNWGFNEGLSVMSDAQGNVYVCGQFQFSMDIDPGPAVQYLTEPTGGDRSGFILKLNSYGNYVWGHVIGGDSANICYSIIPDNSGHIYIGGQFVGTSDFDPGRGVSIMHSAGIWDLYIAKLDTSANLIWSKRMGGPGIDWMSNITLDPNGNVYATGEFEGTSDLDPNGTVYPLTSNGKMDMFICKLDNTGSLDWAVSMGGTNIDYVPPPFLLQRKSIIF